jgi:hypothetical protein
MLALQNRLQNLKVFQKSFLLILVFFFFYIIMRLIHFEGSYVDFKIFAPYKVPVTIELKIVKGDALIFASHRDPFYYLFIF